jgi:hypothetical protein
VNLAATAAGIAFQPLSQALQEYPEMAPLYRDLHARLAPAGGTVQMLARIGYGPEVAPSPRWPLRQHLGHRLALADALTMAEPTTQPSATPAMACAASGVEMPKPTITGRSVAALIRATSGPTSAACAAAAPVIPVIET